MFEVMRLMSECLLFAIARQPNVWGICDDKLCERQRAMKTYSVEFMSLPSIVVVRHDLGNVG